jgi:hypothetical protein
MGHRYQSTCFALFSRGKTSKNEQDAKTAPPKHAQPSGVKL